MTCTPLVLLKARFNRNKVISHDHAATRLILRRPTLMWAMATVPDGGAATVQLVSVHCACDQVIKSLVAFKPRIGTESSERAYLEAGSHFRPIQNFP